MEDSKMYAVQSNVIRGLSAGEYEALREMCRVSNNLYNVALYSVRQHFFDEDEYLRYESNYYACKDNENYKMLQAGVAQQTLKVVDRSFRSFFALVKKSKNGEYRYEDIHIPRYRERGGYFLLICSGNAISIKNGYFRIPMSQAFKREHESCKKILVKFPDRLVRKKIKEVRILPRQNARYFEIQYVYVVDPEPKDLDSNRVMGIDPGLNNLATCVSNVGTPFIIDGRKLKSVNRLWNKRKAKLMSIGSKQGLENYSRTEQIERLTEKRNRRVNDYIKKAARIIVDYCVENRIGTLVVGHNPGQKRNINLGRKNNQNFVQIPLGKLRSQLECLCDRYGIEYVDVEESYTSKCNFLGGDFLPEYKQGRKYDESRFTGKRKKRGLYVTDDGQEINADVNGAFNIIRKCKQGFSKDELCRGCLDHPRRIRVE